MNRNGNSVALPKFPNPESKINLIKLGLGSRKIWLTFLRAQLCENGLLINPTAKLVYSNIRRIDIALLQGTCRGAFPAQLQHNDLWFTRCKTESKLGILRQGRGSV